MVAWAEHDLEGGERRWWLWLTQPLTPWARGVVWGLAGIVSLACWLGIVGVGRLLWWLMS